MPAMTVSNGIAAIVLIAAIAMIAVGQGPVILLAMNAGLALAFLLDS